MHILLMGLRGSGKTTVGRLLARRLAGAFVDLDERVLAAFPESTVTDVWAAHGQEAWRAAEACALGELLAEPAPATTVVALGGGTPMVDAARATLESARAAGTAMLVYLRCDAGELHRRLAAAAGDRPSLTGADPARESAAVLTAREPVFRRLADHEVDVTDATPEQAVAAMAGLVG